MEKNTAQRLVDRDHKKKKGCPSNQVTNSRASVQGDMGTKTQECCSSSAITRMPVQRRISNSPSGLSRMAVKAFRPCSCWSLRILPCPAETEVPLGRAACCGRAVGQQSRGGESQPRPVPSASTSPSGQRCWDPAPSDSSPLPGRAPPPAPTPAPAPAAPRLLCKRKRPQVVQGRRCTAQLSQGPGTGAAQVTRCTHSQC